MKTFEAQLLKLDKIEIGLGAPFINFKGSVSSLCISI
jgi:hypothetical protein